MVCSTLGTRNARWLMDFETAAIIIGSVGGTVGVIGTVTTWLRGGFRHGFDSEQALKDIAALKMRDKELEVQLEEEIKLVNINIIKQITESRTSNNDATNALRQEVVSMNRHILDLTEKIGRLSGLIEGQRR